MSSSPVGIPEIVKRVVLEVKSAEPGSAYALQSTILAHTCPESETFRRALEISLRNERVYCAHLTELQGRLSWYLEKVIRRLEVLWVDSEHGQAKVTLVYVGADKSQKRWNVIVFSRDSSDTSPRDVGLYVTLEDAVKAAEECVQASAEMSAEASVQVKP